MAPPPPPPKVTAPDYKNIPHAHRIPSSHREVQRVFSGLSRQSLLNLVQFWLHKTRRAFCRPYLSGDKSDADGDNGAYVPAHSCEEVLEFYAERNKSGHGSKRELLHRILEGDWRHGITMFQLATAEIEYFLLHPHTLQWTAMRLTKTPRDRANFQDMEFTDESQHLPQFHAPTFLANLAKEITPIVKAHYLLLRPKSYPMTILRVYIHDSPYSNEASLAPKKKSSDNATKALFLIWPDGTDFVYPSLLTSLGRHADEGSRKLKEMVIEAIPKAFSRPMGRYQLLPTKFSSKLLSTVLAYRGPGKSNNAGGGFNIFVETSLNQNSLDIIASLGREALDKNKSTKATTRAPGPGRKRKLEDPEVHKRTKRWNTAQSRFGNSAKPDDGKGINRLEVRMDDPFPPVPNSSPRQNQETSGLDRAQAAKRGRKGRPSLLDRTAEEQEQIESSDEDVWIPDVRISFHGSHVFAGLRQLVEIGIVDGEKMPGWMTGEAGVTIGVVKDGRIRRGEVPGF
ncbi:CHL4-domain-containing protein [Lojkania enalia]|uniref:CHL4-domain-containing protein n=1 Tax=Lojkania enalia TaxID=147567 RepID=A0A9P4N9W1_9PLEO|nr:CHL4-domain-containing protein [Didymosphaeria enalia]